MHATRLPDSRKADGDDPHAQQLHASPHQHAEQHRELRRRSEHVSVDQLFCHEKSMEINRRKNNMKGERGVEMPSEVVHHTGSRATI